MPFGWASAAAAIVPAVTGLVGGAMQSSAVSGAANQANETQRAALAQARTDLSPYMQTGTNALMQAGNAAGMNGADGYASAMDAFHASPGYQYQLGEGTRAVEAAASAQGLAHSGATVKAVQDRAANLASMDFGTYYNRLSGLAGAGQQAATTLASAGTGTAAGIAQTQVSAGGAQAGLYGQAAQGVGNAVNSYRNNSLYDTKSNALFGGNYAAGAGGYSGMGPFA